MGSLGRLQFFFREGQRVRFGRQIRVKGRGLDSQILVIVILQKRLTRVFLLLNIIRFVIGFVIFGVLGLGFLEVLQFCCFLNLEVVVGVVLVELLVLVLRLRVEELDCFIQVVCLIFSCKGRRESKCLVFQVFLCFWQGFF